MTSIPIINTRGYKSALRYLINDVQGRYWAGKEWTGDARRAILYVAHVDAITEARKIILREHRRCPVYQNFRIPLQLEVFAPHVVTHDELRDYTRKALKLGILYADHGLGPIEGSAVVPGIRWGEMYQSSTSEDTENGRSDQQR
jgi:hypothetical protein